MNEITKIINPTTTLQALQSQWGELHRVTPGHGGCLNMNFADEDEPLTLDSSGERLDFAADAFAKSYFIDIVEPFLNAIDGDQPILLTDLLRSNPLQSDEGPAHDDQRAPDQAGLLIV